MISFPITLYNKALESEETIQVTESMQIDNIRTVAADSFQTPASQLLLYWHEVELNDANTIQSIGVRSGDMILVNQRQTGILPAPQPSPNPQAKTILMCMPNGTYRRMEVRTGDTTKSLLARLNYPRGREDAFELHSEDGIELGKEASLDGVREGTELRLSLKVPGASLHSE